MRKGVATVSIPWMGQRNPSASRGSNADDMESRNSPPPGAAGARWLLITAEGNQNGPVANPVTVKAVRVE